MHASAFVFQPHILENLHGKPGKLHTLRRYAFFLLLSRRRSCCKVGQIWIGVERPGLQHCGHTAYFRLPSSRRDDSSSAGSRWHRACQTLTCSDIQRWQSWKWLHLAWRRLARTSTRICVAWWQAVLRHSRSQCCWVSDHNGLHAQDLGEGTWSYFLHLHSKRLPALRIEASAIAIMHRIASIASLRTNISIIARHWISLKRHVLRQQIALGSTTLGLWHLHLEWYLAIHQLVGPARYDILEGSFLRALARILIQQHASIEQIAPDRTGVWLSLSLALHWLQTEVNNFKKSHSIATSGQLLSWESRKCEASLQDLKVYWQCNPWVHGCPSEEGDASQTKNVPSNTKQC